MSAPVDARKHPRPSRRTGEHRPCAVCGASFYVHAYRAATARFCSRTCADAHQRRNKVQYICETCGSTFRWSPSRQTMKYPVRYCSWRCRDADPSKRDQLLVMNTTLQARRTTKVEAAGYALLDSLGVEHQRQQPFAGKFTPDATIPAARLVVQFDGNYWHDRAGTSTEPRIRRRVALDRSQDNYIRASGWTVLRLWETDLLRDPAGCAEQVMQHLRSAR